MDRKYRYGRHVYDVTRRFTLLGCDKLLDRVITGPSTATLEVGCGTARNLLRLAARREPGRLYGLDASHAMLTTAERSIRRVAGREPGRAGVVLRQGLAEDLDARRMFGREERFDTIFFSYCLSMVPAWQQALRAAMANLSPGGVILIVDHWDQRDLPTAFSAGLRAWLFGRQAAEWPEVHQTLVGSAGRAGPMSGSNRLPAGTRTWPPYEPVVKAHRRGRLCDDGHRRQGRRKIKPVTVAA